MAYIMAAKNDAGLGSSELLRRDEVPSGYQLVSPSSGYASNRIVRQADLTRSGINVTADIRLRTTSKYTIGYGTGVFNYSITQNGVTTNKTATSGSTYSWQNGSGEKGYGITVTIDVPASGNFVFRATSISLPALGSVSSSTFLRMQIGNTVYNANSPTVNANTFYVSNGYYLTTYFIIPSEGL